MRSAEMERPSGVSVDWIARARQLKLQVSNFINGRWTGEPGGVPLNKFSARDGTLLCQFGTGQAQEVDEAVANSRRAFEDGRWSKLPVQRRKEVLYRLATLIEQHREELALLESLDVGKPISDALNFDIPASAANIRYSAEGADKLFAKVYGVDQSSLSYELRRPMGVVAGVIGWNFPLLLAVRKIGPALATGNCLVLKPSELTSFSTARVAELALEAGVPEGVLNVIHGGSHIGAALSLHADVDLLTFTGSSQTGKKLLIASGQSNMKRLILECGGKAPNIVFDDCPNFDAVAEAVLKRAFFNQGQVCSAGSRLLVQENIKDKLLPYIVAKCAAWSMGDPLDPRTRFGPMVSRDHREKVLGYIESGKQEGARIAYRCEAKALSEAGFYVPPVIFDEVIPGQKIAQEEIFGPVLSVITFRDEEEAIRVANGTIYGLSGILWTQNLGRAHRVSQGISAGWIVVNATETPTGGITEGALSTGGHKQSGIGTEGGIEGLDAYMSHTVVQLFS